MTDRENTDRSENSADGSVLTKIVLTVLALAALAAVGVFLIFRFVDGERERETHAWQLRLGIVADSRVAAVNDWIERQFRDLSGLAENASFQIYVGEVLASGEESPPELDYLRNLLTVTASSAGYVAPPVGPKVNANVRRIGVAGIAVLDRTGRPLIVTEEMPPLEGELRRFVADLPAGQRALLDLYVDPAGRPAMAFAVPVFAVQGDDTPSAQIGVVLGVKEVGPELFPLLRQPGATEKTGEAVLVRRRGDVVEYLSPLADGTPPLKRQLAMNTPDLAAAFVLETPGGFALRHDYRGEEVLVTGRRVAGAPWSLLYKVDRSEALGPSDARLNRLLVVLILGIALLGAVIAAVWRHGASRRAAEAAARHAAAERELERQGKLLRLVTDNQPNTIFIADASGKYRFANRRAAERATIDAADMVGKSMAAVLGPAAAKRYEDLNRLALDGAAPVTDVHRAENGSGVQVFQSSHIPLLSPEDVLSPAVLVVEEDVTPAVVERERRERLLDQLVKSLIDAVDRRDSHAAHHSVRVAAVARAVAEEMGLDTVEVETAETAGSLMNFGKILVPKEVLTREGDLSDDEIRQVRDSILATAEFLEDIEFDGPVVETLRQVQEHWDGSGSPRGLAGEEILPTARVVAVANAFVALISPRAHRKRKDFDAAVEILLKGVGKKFDRRVVAALINRLDNKGGRAAWAHFADRPDG